MIVVLAAGLAAAGTVGVVLPDGPLEPGLPGVVWVAAVEDDGRIVERTPGVRVDQGRVRALAEAAPEGLFAFEITPAADAAEVVLTVVAAGVVTSERFPVVSVPSGALEAPRRVDARSGSPTTVHVSGPDLPAPEALQVAVPEGARVLGVATAADGTLAVEIDPGDSPFAAFVPVGVRDTRTDAAPTWTGLRVRARQQFQLETEPGTSLEWLVGGRRYGPFIADAAGRVTALFEQYPGEDRATAVLRDELGNESRTEVPLTAQGRAALVPLVTGPRVAGRAPPRLYLRAVDAAGAPWRGADPTCSTPEGPATLIQRTVGEWAVALPAAGAAQDVLVRCALVGADEARFRVRAADVVPTAIRLLVYPEELSTDFPVAEVQAIVEDVRGERLPVRGVRVEAERGEVVVGEDDGYVLRGEYRGASAVEAGEDLLVARYALPRGVGEPGLVDIDSQGFSGDGLAVTGRVLDRTGRPLPGVPVELRAGEARAVVTTGEDGWARATLSVPTQLTRISATAGRRARSSLAVPGARPGAGPGSPDLVARRTVTISHGRVAELSILARSPIYAGPGAVSRVSVRVVDRAGAAVLGTPVTVSASEGTLGPVRQEDDGTWVAEYTPPRGERYRRIEVRAEAEGRSTTTIIEVEPRPITVATGLAVGGLTNFSEIASVLFAVDVEARTGWLGDTIMGRVTVGSYGDTAVVDTGVGEAARVRMSLLPVSLGLLSRRDVRWGALWLGLGAVVAPFSSEVRIGGEVSDRAVGLLPPGLCATGGVALRVPGGELAIELRPVALSSPGGRLGYRGPVGGLGFTGGYRLTY